MYLLVKCIQKLLHTHALIYVHGNNYGDLLKVGDQVLYQYIELTFINRENELLLEKHEKNNLKCDIDYPNWTELGLIYE